MAKSGESVGFLSGQKEQTVNLPAYAFEGSNPSPTISVVGGFFLETAVIRSSQRPQFEVAIFAGVAQLVER